MTQVTDRTSVLQGKSPGSGFYPMPNLARICRPDLRVWRIKQLARFWDQENIRGGESELWKASYSFVKGMSSPLAFILGNLKNELFVGFAADQSSGIKNLLEASYPGIFLQEFPGAIYDLLRKMPVFSSALITTGNPSIIDHDKSDQSLSKVPILDTLVNGLSGYDYFYLVFAMPLDEERQREELPRLYALEKEFKEAYLRPGTPLEKNNPAAEAEMRRIKAAIVKFEEGLQTGLWQAACTLFLVQREAVSQGISVLRSLFSGENSLPQPVNINVCLSQVSESANRSTPYFTLLNSRDLTHFMVLPKQEYQGYKIRPLTIFDKHRSGFKTEERILLGNLVNPPNSPIAVDINHLTKHLLIAGNTGSGKTNTCLLILKQLWKIHRVPFLILETSEKTEYGKALSMDFAEELEIITLGDETRNPLHLNLLQLPCGVHIEAHIGHLMRIFKASFPLPPPTPYLLEEALHLWYSRAGWDILNSKAPENSLPLRMSDLIDIIRELLHTKYRHYDSQTLGTIQAALMARLSSIARGSMGLFFDGQQDDTNVFRGLLKRPVVIEMTNITDPDKKALAVLFLLYRLMSYAQWEYQHSGDRKHITVVEEAHRILRHKEPSLHPDLADTQAAVVEEFGHALAEVRYAGEGLIILDQMPAKLTPGVLANTNMKIVHRLTDEEGQRCVSEAAGLDPQQRRILYRLEPGEALWFSPEGGVFHITIPLFDG